MRRARSIFPRTARSSGRGGLLGAAGDRPKHGQGWQQLTGLPSLYVAAEKPGGPSQGSVMPVAMAELQPHRNNLNQGVELCQRAMFV